MFGLNSTLSIASGAISADSGALAVTNNNIANVNTAGYSRQLVTLSAEALTSGGSASDNGVSFGGYTSVRNQVLQIAIDRKTSDTGSLNVQTAVWSQIETAFSSTGTGVGASLSTFFSNLSGLSTMPDDAVSRQAALTSATQLVAAFHQSASTLSSAATYADGTVAGTVAQINELTNQIAELDTQLRSSSMSVDGGSLQDQRDALTTQLAQLTNVVSTSTSGTPSLSTGNGTPLVIDGTAYSLQVTHGTDGETHVLDANGNDVTASLTGGSLGGALQMRDTQIPQLSTKLDQLASDFASAINAAQAQGYDQNGQPGPPLFTIPANGIGAAAEISLAVSDPASLAVSADGSPGSSGNLDNLLAVQRQALPSGQTPTDSYASMVQTVGNSSSEASGTLQATTNALNQLNAQQASESGVSIDEETTNLLRYQQAYAAAAKVISTINQLYSTLMNMS